MKNSPTMSATTGSSAMAKPAVKRDQTFHLRLSVLVALLLGLGYYGWRTLDWQRRTRAARITVGNYEDRSAIKTIEELETDYGRRGETEFLKARAYRHLNDEKRFEEHIRSAQRLNYDPMLIQQEESLMAVQNGQFQQSSEEILRLLASSGSDLDEVALGLCYGFILSTHFEDIQKIMPYWKENSPKSGKPYLIEGMVAQHFQKWSEADVALTEALQLSPGLFPAVVTMGHNKLRLNQHAEAVPYFEEYLKQAPDDVEAKLGLANSLIGSQQSDRALELLKEWVGRGDSSFDLRFLLGQTLLNSGEAEHAWEALEPLQKVWPKDVKLNLALSQVYSQLSQEEKSSEYAKVSDAGRELIGNVDQMMREIEANPKDARRKYELGKLMLHYSSRDSGRYWLEAAVRIDPNLREAHQELELYYQRAGDREKASYHAKAASSRQTP